MWEVGLQITVFPHRTVRQADQCLDETEKSRWKVGPLSSWSSFTLLCFRPSPLDKFSESFWRWTFYFLAHVYSIWALADKPWVWNTLECWYGYPEHTLGTQNWNDLLVRSIVMFWSDSEVWWHYMIEMAFYWSLFFTQFSDVKRKDFMEMFVHHLATLALLTLSWTTQMFRIGSLVILVHDFADHWMELAKMARYANYNVRSKYFQLLIEFWVSLFVSEDHLRRGLPHLHVYLDSQIRNFSHLDYLHHNRGGGTSD